MAALLVDHGKGDVIADRPERTALIKAARKELTLTWFRYEEGQRGPPPHIHRKHSDCFYVIDGQMTFELGDGEVVRGDPGTIVIVPPNVVHTFRNEGPATGRFLNVHAPSCGFHDYLRARRDGRDDIDWFDQFEPPPGGGRPASDAVIAVGEASHDGLSFAETAVESEERPAAATTSSYWVLDGTLTVRAGAETLDAGSGAYVLVPPGERHALAGPARVVSLAA
jgi:quercetin dioxygenase-like cupin family protein